MGSGLQVSAVRGTGRDQLRVMTCRLAGIGFAAFLLILPLDLHSQDRQLSGKIYIKQVQIAFIGSGNLGGGTLDYKGKKYRFTVGGLGIGGFGYSEMEANGEVYDLKKVEDFAGAYAQGRYGVVAGSSDTGELWLQNDQGVSLHLKTHREGLALSLGAVALYIKVEK